MRTLNYKWGSINKYSIFCTFKTTNEAESSNTAEFVSNNKQSITTTGLNDTSKKSYPTNSSNNARNQRSTASQPRERQPMSQQQQQKGRNSREQQQVYRVDNMIASNPQAIKEALTQAAAETVAPSVKAPPKQKINALQGIDLSSAGVVIVDYLPEVVTRNHSNDGQSDDENDMDNENDDDGFQQVMTKKGKKIEKMKAAQAAAAAAALAASIANRSSKANMAKNRDLKSKIAKRPVSSKTIGNKVGDRKTPTPIPSLFSTIVKPVNLSAGPMVS